MIRWVITGDDVTGGGVVDDVPQSMGDLEAELPIFIILCSQHHFVVIAPREVAPDEAATGDITQCVVDEPASEDHSSDNANIVQMVGKETSGVLLNDSC